MDEGREDEEFHEDEESSKLEYDAVHQQLKRIKDDVTSTNPGSNLSQNIVDAISSTSETQDTDKKPTINTINTTDVKGKSPNNISQMVSCLHETKHI